MERQEQTILSAIAKIHETSKNAKLQTEKYRDIQQEIQRVCDYFRIDTIQSIILSSIIGVSGLGEIELREVVEYFDMDKLAFLRHLECVIKLTDKGIITISSSYRHERGVLRTEYLFKETLAKYLIANQPIPDSLLSPKEYEFEDFLKEIDKVRNNRDEEDYGSYRVKLSNVIEKGRHFKIASFAEENLDFVQKFMFFDVIFDALQNGDNDYNSSLHSTISDFARNKREVMEYMSDFIEGKTDLNSLNLVEKNNSQFGDRHKVRLTEKAIEMLAEMEGIKLLPTENKDKKLFYPEAIKEVNLFYNPTEEQQLNVVLNSMSHEAFTTLQERLQASNMPKGVTALLYGAAGTGKTESVYQIARKYNRPVFKVEISETKSMWFGESQKLVKKVFTDYYDYKKREKICPILLFNEADAVIGKRKAAGSTSVADTENAIQNVLLEELERFDGILFATSNLVDNIDSAFERRFLFKVKFETPSPENAARIWQSKLSNISQKEAEVLADRFRFSGGEMENIARKCVMEEVVLGNKVTLETIIRFCESEKWESKHSIPKIGFKKEAA